MHIKLPRLPAHEIAAARARARILGLPRPVRAKPTPPPIDTFSFIPGWRSSAVEQGFLPHQD